MEACRAPEHSGTHASFSFVQIFVFMKRNLDLIRDILEQLDDGPVDPRALDLPLYRPAQVDAHLKMLDEEGFISCSERAAGVPIGPCALEDKGRSFLLVARNEKHWPLMRRMGDSTQSLSDVVLQAKELF